MRKMMTSLIAAAALVGFAGSAFAGGAGGGGCGFGVQSAGKPLLTAAADQSTISQPQTPAPQTSSE